MRYTKFFFIFNLLSLTVGIVAVTACSSSQNFPIPVIPSNWKKVDLRNFSFLIPPDMNGREVKGTDTSGWEFRNDGMTLDVSFGIYPDNLVGYSNQPDYREQLIEVDGEKGKLSIFRLDDSLAAHFPGEGKYVAAIHFSEPKKWKGGSLTMWANCQDNTGQETAKKIFSTIKFK